jgi:uncharacterized protein YjbI with pentapeptide repeats
MDSSYLAGIIKTQGVRGWNAFRASYERDAWIQRGQSDTRTWNLQGQSLKGLQLDAIDFTEVNLRYADLSGSSLNLAQFVNADLTGAVLDGCSLVKADFQRATLIGTKLMRGTNLEGVIMGANLEGADLYRAKLDASNLTQAILIGANLSRASLRDAILEGANLRAATATGADFDGACLTGACIDSWKTDKRTSLKEVICEYVYRRFNFQHHSFSSRLPINPDATLAFGEFKIWSEVRAHALETIDLTFPDGIDWRSFFDVLRQVRSEVKAASSEAEIFLQGVDEKFGQYVVRLSLETGKTGNERAHLEAKVETLTRQLYDAKLVVAKSHGKIEALEDQLNRPTYHIVNPSFGGGFAASGAVQVGGSLSLSQAKDWNEAVNEIQQVLAQLEIQTVPESITQHELAEILVACAQQDVILMGKLVNWAKLSKEVSQTSKVSDCQDIQAVLAKALKILGFCSS